MPASAQIYEGANGIQALDLVGRKLPQPGRALPAALLPPGRRLHRGQQGRPGARRHRGAGGQGARQAADRDAGRRPTRPGRPGGGRRRGVGLSQDVRAGGGRLHVVPDGEARHARSRTATPSTTPSSRPPASTCRRSCRIPPGSSSRSWPVKAPSWPTAPRSSSAAPLSRHGRACPGHPRGRPGLARRDEMPGYPEHVRAGPGMTVGGRLCRCVCPGRDTRRQRRAP